jgi:hypothetical protein
MEQRTPRTIYGEKTHKKGTWSVWITNHCVDNRKYLLENNHKVVIDSLIDCVFCHVIVALYLGVVSLMLCASFSWGEMKYDFFSAMHEPLLYIWVSFL